MTSPTVGIAGAAYRLPDTVLGLEELHARGSLRSAPETLAGFGFRAARVAETESALEMAMDAVGRLLAETGILPEEIGVVLYAGALASSSTLAPDPGPTAALHLSELADLFGFVPRSMLAQSARFRQGEALIAGGFVAMPSIVRVRDRITTEGGIDVRVPMP